MGIFDRLRRKSLTADPAVVEALQARAWNPYRALGGTNVRVNQAIERAQAASYGFMYAQQPAVRTVVDKIASDLSQLPLKLFERVSDTERQRDTDHPAARTMRYPNPTTPADQWLFDYTADWLIYNNAYAIKFTTGRKNLPLTLVRVPPQRVSVLGNGAFTIIGYRVRRDDGSTFDVAPEDMIHLRGYDPDEARLGLSPMETLRLTLVEEAASQAASTDLARNGLRGGHIERPLEAPEWSSEAMQRFLEGWTNQVKASPRKTPVLEEGMEFKDDVLSPKDAEMLKGREFTLQTVARLYDLPVELFFPEGDREEARRAYYSDLLAPRSQRLAAQFDHSILAAEYDETDDYYFEFDLNEKLRGEPEKRFAAITAAVGAPWMLRDEARSLENLPPVEDGDELVTPLNVLVGSNPKPAPNVMGPQDPNKPAQDGSHREPMPEAPKQISSGLQDKTLIPRRKADMDRQRRYVDEAIALLERFYARQSRSLVGKSAFDAERWNRELADDLHKLVHSIVEREGGFYTARLGGNDFDMGRVRHYLRAQAEDTAAKLNATTQRDFEGDSTAREAIDRARGERAAVAGASVGTRSTVFARQEAAKQAPQSQYRKQVWIADTDRHADLDGVAVPLDSDWGGIEPGSEPNCMCSVAVE